MRPACQQLPLPLSALGRGGTRAALWASPLGCAAALYALTLFFCTVGLASLGRRRDAGSQLCLWAACLCTRVVGTFGVAPSAAVPLIFSFLHVSLRGGLRASFQKFTLAAASPPCPARPHRSLARPAQLYSLAVGVARIGVAPGASGRSLFGCRLLFSPRSRGASSPGSSSRNVSSPAASFRRARTLLRLERTAHQQA